MDVDILEKYNYKKVEIVGVAKGRADGNIISSKRSRKELRNTTQSTLIKQINAGALAVREKPFNIQAEHPQHITEARQCFVKPTDS